MGLYKHLSKLNRNKSKIIRFQRERLIGWRRESNIVKIERPTNLISARRLGYKAKKGFILVRVRVPRGGKMKPQLMKGRKPKQFGRRFVMSRSYQVLAEQRANKIYQNLEVLNSYKAGQDGIHYWFEVIMLDPCSPDIMKDKHVSWIKYNVHKGRVQRGLTSAGKKSRGMLGKGKGREKVRPSIRANKGRAK